MTNEYVSREKPAARILIEDTGRYMIDVEGTPHTVVVTREGATAPDRSGAY
jgi:hypothetical protein